MILGFRKIIILNKQLKVNIRVNKYVGITQTIGIGIIIKYNYALKHFVNFSVYWV